jgi:polar amino acid transport system substrate-binding protein
MRSTPRTLALTALSALAPLALLAGCAPAEAPTSASSAASPSGSASASAAACSKDSLQVRTPGKLTIGTDDPAYAPWFVDFEPSNGKGYESAVAYAVAERLGFATTDVTWTTAQFNNAIAPGPKTFDFDVNQISITEERKKNVDFSSGYYDVTQTVVTVTGSKAAGAKSLADLKGLKLGAQVGTTSLQAIERTIAPSGKPAVFNTNDDAKLALANGTVDAIVVDSPTALYLSTAKPADGGLENGQIVGQLPGASGQPEQFGLVLDKGSPLTSCVTQAVDALRADGTLQRLDEQWLAGTAKAPILQ